LELDPPLVDELRVATFSSSRFRPAAAMLRQLLLFWLKLLGLQNLIVIRYLKIVFVILLSTNAS